MHTAPRRLSQPIRPPSAHLGVFSVLRTPGVSSLLRNQLPLGPSLRLRAWLRIHPASSLAVIRCSFATSARVARALVSGVKCAPPSIFLVSTSSSSACLLFFITHGADLSSVRPGRISTTFCMRGDLRDCEERSENEEVLGWAAGAGVYLLAPCALRTHCRRSTSISLLCRGTLLARERLRTTGAVGLGAHALHARGGIQRCIVHSWCSVACNIEILHPVFFWLSCTLHPPLLRDEHSDLRIRPPIHALDSIPLHPPLFPRSSPFLPSLRIFSTYAFGTKILQSRRDYVITTDAWI
ncbi:hypothetical protein B0H13DRAFT_2349508 [Mycena leptocephala]|nr:hypothetical protein B0H13DRAFT_2349508 [Mycena leptocephala]